MIAFLLAFAMTQDTSGAYLDARAAELVQRARARRQVVDQSITHYEALAKERISMGLRSRLRDRLVWRRETASRIDWNRGGPINITVVGAREAVPVASPIPAIPGNLEGFLPRLAFDPLDMDELIRFDTTSMRHPLATGAEAFYQYRTGDSTTITVGERTIRLVELRVIPRHRDFRLISGSFWIDADSHSVVQIVFRMAKDFDFAHDVEDDGTNGIVKWKRFMSPMRAELQYVTIEYGLINLRWWMPRLFAAEGVMQFGALKTPLHYERSYSEYEVQGDTAPSLIARTVADSLMPRCRPDGQMVVVINRDRDSNSPEDLERRRKLEEQRRAAVKRRLDEWLAADTARARRYREGEACARKYHVVIADSAKLLNAPELPGSVFGDMDVLATDPELARLAEQLNDLAEPPWQMHRARFTWGFDGRDLVRYDKIEGLSVGARGEFDFSRLRADATVRIGTADRVPRLELGVTRATPRSTIHGALYRRLDVMDDNYVIGTPGHTFGALVNGRDDRDYLAALGGELTLAPAEANPQWYALRAFGEQQRPLREETNFSLRHALDNDHRFALNRRADHANQVGAELTLHGWHGQDASRVRCGAELSLLGSAGTYDFTREALTLQMLVPLPLKLATALEVGAGISTGIVPVQSNWFLGGNRTMRGFPIGQTLGTAFWRARGEVARGIPLARIGVFSDVGWAGDRARIQANPPYWSAGVGLSTFDGLLRLDLARRLRGGKGWRLELSADGML